MANLSMQRQDSFGGLRLVEPISFTDNSMFGAVKLVAEATGIPPRTDEIPLNDDYVNIAASLQHIFEEEVLKMADFARQQTGEDNLIFCGPVGVGKSWFAQALGHSACRAGHRVRFIKAAKLVLALRQARADHSFERELRTWLSPVIIIFDDFGLRKLATQESSDLYDVLVERDGRAATIITSNRAVDEWVALFDDPILANSALDRFAHRAHQIVMEGPSLRAARAPGAGKPGRRPAPDTHG